MGNINQVNLEVEDILHINYSIYKNPEQKYDLPVNIAPSKPEDLIIKNAYSIEKVKQILENLIDEFPKQELLVNQAALWVSAFSSFHFFYDANHRTGEISFEYLMKTNNLSKYDPLDGITEFYLENILNQSKETRRLGKRDKVYKKDETYYLWREYFNKVL